MEAIKELIEPISRRFIYHFMVAPRTATIQKPEWYLRQNLKWIHRELDNIKGAETRSLFILGMLELAHKRLSRDVKTFLDLLDQQQQQQFVERLLIHTYNEVVDYTKVIKQLLGDQYKDLEEKHDMMALFSHQKLFQIIIDVEWDHAITNLKQITRADDKWDSVLQGDYVDYYKIPRCTDRFLLLMKAISERVECFRQTDCQFQLIDQQCLLFNKFLDTMKQATESSTVGKNIFTDMFLLADDTIDLSKILKVLNGLNFLRLILQEKCFIPKELINILDKTLLERLNTTTRNYVNHRNKLIDMVITIYKQVDCDHRSFMEFIRPKLSHNIFELIRDEASEISQKRQTETMLGGLSLG